MSTVTVVTAFYHFQKSKHTIQEYITWIYNFLINVDTFIVLFTDNPFCQIVSRMRDEAGLTHKLHIIQKPFDEVKFSSPEWIATWTKQLEIDSLAHLHGHELFRVWANKPFFVEEAIQLNPFQSEAFVWCDAGCWRDPTVARICGPGWPAVQKITPNQMHILTVNSMRPFLQQLTSKDSWTHEAVVRDINVRDQAIVGGTILLGDKQAWSQWIPAFEASLNYYIQNNLFAGDDQTVITSTVLWLRANNQGLSPILYDAPKQNHFFILDRVHMGNLWFAFQQHFSKHDFKLTTY
jgi:hypothetical protein